MDTSSWLKTFPALYKMSSSGKIQEWQIFACMENGFGSYIIIHGQLDGKKQETETKVLAGKNIGKSNETSIWEQTQLEAESKWNKQKDRKGYSETIPTAKEKQFRPMLAKSYCSSSGIDDLKDGKHIVYPAYAQPKLDGIRCTIDYPSGRMFSRQGKEFTVLKHISDAAVRSFGLSSQFFKLDGELYVHGENFQQLVSAIKRDEPSDFTTSVEYHIYDVFSDKSSFEARNAWLSMFEDYIKRASKGCIKLVPTIEVRDHKHMKDVYEQFIEQGYEGLMLRNKHGEYKVDGRSSDLQKVKSFIDQEFSIVGAEQNKGKMENQCTFICETPDGTRFGVKPKGDDATREKYWSDWKSGIIKPGQLMTVEFFAWTDSEHPVPRFPVGKCIRDYE